MSSGSSRLSFSGLGSSYHTPSRSPSFPTSLIPSILGQSLSLLGASEGASGLSWPVEGELGVGSVVIRHHGIKPLECGFVSFDGRTPSSSGFGMSMSLQPRHTNARGLLGREVWRLDGQIPIRYEVPISSPTNFPENPQTRYRGECSQP